VSFRGLEKDHRARRYELVPQFEQYDANDLYLRPYVTFCSRPRLSNPVFSTDAYGYRLSSSPIGMIDADRWLTVGGGGLVLGGSFVFGVGATSDAATLPSRLAHLTGVPYLNLGIYAGNSLQELVASIPFLEKARTVVVCSGINNVFSSVQSLGHNELYGPLFFEGALATLGRTPIPDLVAEGADASAPPAEGGDAARVVPSTDTAGDLQARLDGALRRQLRDLSVLAGAVRGRLLFCLQPFADPALRDPSPQEQRLYDLAQERQGSWTRARDFVAASWEAHTERLARGCGRLGVDFVDLPARAFTGWSFNDRVHMTDHGYAQAADLVMEAL
jgi:hypothetical protein